MANKHNAAQKIALITGITGQDGSYLAEFLLEKGYIVHGIKRRASSFNTDRIDHLYQDPHVNHRDLVLHYGDLSDTSNLVRIIQECQPDEIYNLGAQSHVAVSFESPEYTADVDGMGPPTEFGGANPSFYHAHRLAPQGYLPTTRFLIHLTLAQQDSVANFVSMGCGHYIINPQVTNSLRRQSVL